MTEFRWPLRVYYEDTDAGGVVYHASYLRFMERARTEWLRSHGFDQSVLRERHGVLFVVRRMAIEFLRTAGLDEKLTVTACLESCTRARLVVRQAVLRGEGRDAGDAVCTARVEIACLDARTHRPRRLPEAVARELDIGS